MKNIIFLVSIAILLFSCSGTPSGTNKTGNAVNDNLFTVAKEINKKCPIITDENTRMDSATVFNEYMITYHYTIHTINNKDVDITKFKNSLQTTMNEKYKTDPQLAIYRDNKIAIAYDYKDKNAGFLCYFICEIK